MTVKGLRAYQITGCALLTAEQWKEGWRSEGAGPIMQHNCPLLKQDKKGLL